jgi:DNA-binding CsgD family transcriptional regulator/PAS domain-containing protein
MGKSRDLRAITEHFAPAAFDPAQWMPALDRLTDAVGATGVVLIPFNVEDRPLGSVATEGAGEVVHRWAKEGWYAHDLRARTIPKLLSTGIAVDQDTITEEEMRRSPYYNELIGPCGLQWWAGVAFSAGDAKWCMSIQRSAAQGPFTPAEQGQLAVLRGPLTTVATIARELGFAQAHGMADAFDTTGTAAFLIDRQGRVIRANRAAEAMLGEGLNIRARRLRADDCDTSNSIDRLIHQAVASFGNGSSVTPPLAVLRSGRRPLVAYALPLAGVIRDLLSPARAMVVVRDLDARPRPSETLLRSCFDLAAAEARLAARLASGDALDHVADEIGIALETARNQLKAIFAKTDTHRQAELVAVLARLPTHFRRPPWPQKA